MADGVIARLAVAVEADTRNFSKGAKKVGKEAKELQRIADSALSRLGGGTITGAAIAGVASITAAVAAGVAEFNRMRTEIDATAKSARKLGLTFDQLSDLRFAADIEGIANIDTAIQRATRRISEAAAGKGAAQGALAELGLSAEKLNQLNPEAQLEAIAQAFQQVENDADRLRLAVKLFDSEGADMVRLLDGGAAK